ncbi:hypothetical protein D9757_005649 [Collybiopsis confluens]|uniref:O-fucosyltransferase family protein n=1 Tax=Collybiopsis confluens TaxID=2823264 RepID=A0A8H5HST5_9AGAR|nr:hypothetical protein D9757_005649 [Collybiopsis confluens]
MSIIEVDPHIEVCPRRNSPNEKFLSYLPHSGFNNQRIALENALTLSHILNRTLLIPPIRLGTPLRYVNYDSLYSFLALSGKDNLRHCSKISLNLPLPPECLDYFDYTFLPWDWLFDFPPIRALQSFIFRWNLTDAWIRECLNISSSDVHTFKDSSRYHFRFVDGHSAKQSKYLENIDIGMMASLSEPLLQIGTLFGSSRLHLAHPGNHRIRSQFRSSMVLMNPLLLQAAELVGQRLGDSFLGVHVRLGDGQFQLERETKARAVWLSLLKDVIGLSAEDTLALEEDFGSRVDSDLETVDNDSLRQCRGLYHTKPQLMALNTPLYIATDATDKDPSLALFFDTFPCTFVLSDFLGSLTALTRINNLYDGLELKKFLLPFIDAMIVGKARHATGTPGSTFSAYVTDVLWSSYRNFVIAERG